MVVYVGRNIGRWIIGGGGWGNMKREKSEKKKEIGEIRGKLKLK
jgi:hypothetical protein